MRRMFSTDAFLILCATLSVAGRMETQHGFPSELIAFNPRAKRTAATPCDHSYCSY